MSEHDIRTRKEETAEAIDQYENHARDDHASMQLLREQCSCLAHLVWEQKMYICDLNDRDLRHIIDERKRIFNGNDASIHKNVDDIVVVMKELQLSLQRRHEVISGILTRST
jgi:macrodomain Ter protein organizer (MatP/YcbG family)